MSSSKAADALDRAAGRRRNDVEAAVRRLQAELQHALDIERSRNAEAAAGRDAAAAAASAARGAAAASGRAAKEIEEHRQRSEASKVSIRLSTLCMRCYWRQLLACMHVPTNSDASLAHTNACSPTFSRTALAARRCSLHGML